MMEKAPARRHLYERERGQSLVEMAFGLIIIVTLFSGLVDLGRAYFVLIAMEDAAGEAVLFLSVFPGCEEPGIPQPEPVKDPYRCDDFTKNAVYRYQNAPGTQLNWSESADRLGIEKSHRICRDILDDGTCLPTSVSPGAGEQYVIELKYSFELITPIITDLVGSDGIELTVKASQIVLTE